MAPVVETLLSREKIKEIIGKRVAKELKEGDVVTLGIGLPNEVLNYLPKNKHITVQSENGALGIGKPLDIDNEMYDKRIINSGGAPVDFNEGACFFDTQMAFLMMRGGHIDVTVLGALQVDEEGSIASWQIPDKFIPGIGGSMDLVIGSKKVIVAMEHLSKGTIKIVKKCNMPLTAYKEVDMVVTERCVFEYKENKMYLTEINPMYTIDDIRISSLADFEVSPNLKTMEI